MSTANDTISVETHEALLEKARKDAVEVTENALASKTEEAAALTTQVAELTTKADELASENERLNKDLDEAQLKLKAATDEVATLTEKIESAEEAARKAELAAARTEQAKNLGLFTDEYIADKASAWADLAEEAWTDRVEEWSNLAPKTPEKGEADTASAMTGTSKDGLSAEVDTASTTPKINARRAALGLTS